MSHYNFTPSALDQHGAKSTVEHRKLEKKFLRNFTPEWLTAGNAVSGLSNPGYASERTTNCTSIIPLPSSVLNFRKIRSGNLVFLARKRLRTLVMRSMLSPGLLLSDSMRLAGYFFRNLRTSSRKFLDQFNERFFVYRAWSTGDFARRPVCRPEIGIAGRFEPLGRARGASDARPRETARDRRLARNSSARDAALGGHAGVCEI